MSCAIRGHYRRGPGAGLYASADRRFHPLAHGAAFLFAAKGTAGLTAAKGNLELVIAYTMLGVDSASIQ